MTANNNFCGSMLRGGVVLKSNLRTLHDLRKFELPDMTNKLALIESKNIDSYLLSGAYYGLTGRKGAWVYSKGDNFVIAIKHPHVNNSLIIFPEVCNDSDFSLTAELIDNIYDGKNEIYLCRYTDLDFAKLDNQLNDSLSLEKIVEENLDWKYPLHILDTQIVSELKGSEFQKIRNKCLRVGKNVDTILIEGKNQINLMSSILKSWSQRLISTGRETEDMFGFYNELLSLFQKGFEISGLCFIREGNPMGFTIWDVCNGTANLFVNLSDPTVVGASDFQMVATCRYLQKLGIQFLNVGGSEMDTLDTFKKKYKPVLSHEVFTYKLVKNELKYGYKIPSEEWPIFRNSIPQRLVCLNPSTQT